MAINVDLQPGHAHGLGQYRYSHRIEARWDFLQVELDGEGMRPGPRPRVMSPRLHGDPVFGGIALANHIYQVVRRLGVINLPVEFKRRVVKGSNLPESRWCCLDRRRNEQTRQGQYQQHKTMFTC